MHPLIRSDLDHHDEQEIDDDGGDHDDGNDEEEEDKVDNDLSIYAACTWNNIGHRTSDKTSACLIDLTPKLIHTCLKKFSAIKLPVWDVDGILQQISMEKTAINPEQFEWEPI